MKKQILLFLAVTFLLIILVVSGTSYAHWLFASEENMANVVATDCLKVDFTDDTNGIYLPNVLPMTDQEGMSTEPYQFTIQNTCSSNVMYEIYLEELKGSDLSDEYLKVELNTENKEEHTLGILNGYEKATPTIKNAQNSRKLYTEYFSKEGSVQYNLRLWLDENTKASSKTNSKTYQGKITVKAFYTSSVPTEEEKCIKKYGENALMCKIIAEVDTNNVPQIGKAAVSVKSKEEIKEQFASILAQYKDSPYYDQFAFTYDINHYDTTNGLYKTFDDYGASYYFRGEVENNYVVFANKMWRIIRVNGDDSIRLIYTGEYDPNKTKKEDYQGSNSQITTAVSFNTNASDNAYVGYMYGDVPSTSEKNAQTNKVDSTIKKALDAWYEVNLQNTIYEKMISDTLFCNDRSIMKEEVYQNFYEFATKLGIENQFSPFGNWYHQNEMGFGEKETYYRGYDIAGKDVTYRCENPSDRFTVTDKTIGNGALTYPIGLITQDEITYAGGIYIAANTHFYLYNGSNYWTMSSGAFFGDFAYVRAMYYDGTLMGNSVNFPNGVRPVINLKAGVKMTSGNGTLASPYELLVSSE